MAGNQVFVVPGIGGSTLSYKGGSGGKTKLYYNVSKIAQLTPLSLALANDGRSPYPIIGKDLFPDGPVDLGLYEPLLTQLANDGWTPVFWAYDWRFALDTIAGQFAAFLTQKASGNFYVIAHSMGGLVAQLAYQILAAQGFPVGNWSRTVYMGTPQGGSMWAGAYLAGLYTTGPLIRVMMQNLGLTALISPLGFFVTTAIRQAMAIAVGSWPSIYGLLPNINDPWKDNNQGGSFLLLSSTYANGAGGVQQQWLTAAAALQTKLVQQLSLPRPAEMEIVGDGFDTPYAFLDSKNPQFYKSYATTPQGDGSVIDTNAVLPATHSVTFKNTDHQGIVNTAGPLSSISSYLRDGLTTSIVLPNAPQIPANPGPGPGLFIPLDPYPNLNKTGDP